MQSVKSFATFTCFLEGVQFPLSHFVETAYLHPLTRETSSLKWERRVGLLIFLCYNKSDIAVDAFTLECYCVHFQAEFPVTPDYGKVVYGGCRGFAKGVMSWPQDLIIGGARQADKKLKSAEAFQSVFLVASPNDVFLRFKVFFLSFFHLRFSPYCWLAGSRMADV